MDHVMELWEKAKTGDQAAAAELVEQHYQRVYAWLRRLAGNDEDAADLTQKVFIRAWKALDRFEGRSSLSTWLHGIGHHVYLDWRRQAKPTDHPSEQWWERCVADDRLPSETAAERELGCQLYSQVEFLDEKTRQTVHLHYYQGLSIAETAETLNVATSTVKYRLRQAVEHLRQRMQEPKLSGH